MDTTSVLQRLRDLRTEKTKGVRFVDAKGTIRRYSYSEVVERASRVAGSLLRKGARSGDPVILVMTTPESAIMAVLGCMMAGCPPTPVYPPQNLKAVPSFLRFVSYVAERSHASLIIGEGQPLTFLGSVPHETGIRDVLKFETLLQNGSPQEIIDENPTAFLQFTSGSTSQPKGVIVSHKSLAANLWMIRDAAHMDESSCVVTWLPVYHDMGLIGTVLNAITLPCDLVVLSPLTFLKKPRLWLELITESRGTHTAAPNFAYGLCARRVSSTDGLNLSSMTTFICGAEPVIPKTMENFIEFYSSAGLRPEAIVPAYGLAEATLAVTFTPHLRGLITDRVDLDSISDVRIAAPARDNNAHSIRIASCGRPMSGVQVRIASEDDKTVKERNVGEIQVLGPNVTEGYIGDPEGSDALKTADGWLRTGDLGYMVNGELYVCGRIKDVIIIRGKKYHAHDLESLTSEVRGIRTGNVVVFSSQRESGEELVVVAEAREENANLPRDVRTHLSQSIGITPDQVVIVSPGTLPKTSSGKLKRSETKRRFESNELQVSPGKIEAYLAAIKSGFGYLKKKQ